jgi:hypothetical protein
MNTLKTLTTAALIAIGLVAAPAFAGDAPVATLAAHHVRHHHRHHHHHAKRVSHKVGHKHHVKKAA